MVCAPIFHGKAADPASPQSGRVKVRHAAVVHMPQIIDMSYADPKSWHDLPPAVQVSPKDLAQELDLPANFSSRSRSF
jgi:hypothetical protein